MFSDEQRKRHFYINLQPNQVITIRVALVTTAESFHADCLADGVIQITSSEEQEIPHVRVSQTSQYRTRRSSPTLATIPITVTWVSPVSGTEYRLIPFSSTSTIIERQFS